MIHSRPRRPAPIPGTEQPRRGLFVDRWGTLLQLLGGEPGQDFRATEFVRGGVEALHYAANSGWYVYLIGNEEAVAKGRVSDESWNDFQAALDQVLFERGVRIRRSYACLDLPDGVGPHAKKSIFQLPDTGIFFHACQEDGLDLRESWAVGDSTVELVAATRAGLRAAAVRTGLALSDREFDLEPELEGRDLADVVRSIVASRVV